MTEVVKQHLPIIIVVFLIGIIATVYALLRIHDSAAGMDVSTFSMAVFIVPCISMVICSFIVMMTAPAIGRQLFVVVTAICFVTGLIAMVLTSSWFSDPEIAMALLANSADDATITVPTNSPLIVMRNIAAYIVAPTVGSILGAWIGSRIHPMARA